MDSETLMIVLLFAFVLGAGVGFYGAQFIF